MMSFSSDGLVEDKQVIVWDRSRLAIFTVMISSVILTYLAMDLESYAVNEYTQNFIKMNSFPNESLQTNFSACSNSNHSSPAYKKFAKVQQDAARWQMYNTIGVAIPAIFTTMVLPSYTDTYGRKFLFILSTVGISIKIAISAVVIRTQSSLGYIVGGCVVQGVTGSSYSLLSMSYTYVADITEKGQQRSLLLAIVEGILITASTVIGLVAGFFIQYTGYFYPALTASAVALVSLFVMIFLLKESLPRSRRVTKAPSILQNVKRTVDFYTSKDFKGKRMSYILLILAYVFSYLGSVHRRALETLYQLGRPFCWTPKQIGYFASLRQVGQGAIGITIAKLLQRCLTDETLALSGVICNMISYIMEALTTTDWVLYMVAIPATFAFLTDPMIRGLMSAMTPADKQGALFASLSVVQSLCWLTATVADNNVYAATVSIMNGFVFLLLAAFVTIAGLLIGLYMLTKSKNKDRVLDEKHVDEISS